MYNFLRELGCKNFIRAEAELKYPNLTTPVRCKQPIAMLSHTKYLDRLSNPAHSSVSFNFQARTQLDRGIFIVVKTTRHMSLAEEFKLK